MSGLLFDDDGPIGTAMEDLEALGLAPLTEGKMPPQFEKNAGKKSDDDDDDDDDNGNGNGEKDDYKDDDDKGNGDYKKDADVKSEDEDNTVIDLDSLDEEDTEALTNALYEYAQDQALDEETYNQMLADTEFVEGFATGFFEDEETDFEEADIEKFEAALDVVEAFEQQLQVVAEGDEDAKPSYDDLVGVVESYEYITEILARIKGGKIIRGLKARAAGAMQKARAAFGKGKHLVKVGRRYVARGAASAKKRILGKRAGRKAQRGAGKAHKKKAERRSQAAKAKHSDVDQTQHGSPISELVQNLNALQEAVAEGEQAETAHDELMSGLQSIHETSTAFFERIAAELAEDENVDPDLDKRVAMGRHLEAIAKDSVSVAESLNDPEATDENGNEFTLEDYADDLATLANDLDKAMEAMKAIE